MLFRAWEPSPTEAQKPEAPGNRAVPNLPKPLNKLFGWGPVQGTRVFAQRQGPDIKEGVGRDALSAVRVLGLYQRSVVNLPELGLKAGTHFVRCQDQTMQH